MSEANKYAQVMERVATDPDYKDRFLDSPKAVLEEAGFSFPPGVNVEVVYDTADTIHAVLPFDHSGEGDNFAC